MLVVMDDGLKGSFAGDVDESGRLEVEEVYEQADTGRSGRIS